MISCVALVSCLAGGAIGQESTPNEIKFNAGSIKTLPKQDQERILMILRSTKLISPTDDLSVLDGLKTTDILNDHGRALCKTVCESGSGTAQGACAVMNNTTARAVCYITAGAGETYCKDRCEPK
jgi:hypothetical protein